MLKSLFQMKSTVKSWVSWFSVLTVLKVWRNNTKVFVLSSVPFYTMLSPLLKSFKWNISLIQEALGYKMFQMSTQGRYETTLTTQGLSKKYLHSKMKVGELLGRKAISLTKFLSKSMQSLPAFVTCCFPQRGSMLPSMRLSGKVSAMMAHKSCLLADGYH